MKIRLFLYSITVFLSFSYNENLKSITIYQAGGYHDKMNSFNHEMKLAQEQMEKGDNESAKKTLEKAKNELNVIEKHAKEDVPGYVLLRAYLHGYNLYPGDKIYERDRAKVIEFLTESFAKKTSEIDILMEQTAGTIPPPPPFEPGIPVPPPFTPEPTPTPGPKPTPKPTPTPRPGPKTKEEKRRDLESFVIDIKGSPIGLSALIEKIDGFIKNNEEFVNEKFPGTGGAQATRLPKLYLNELRKAIQEFSNKIKGASEAGTPIEPDEIKEKIDTYADVFNTIVKATAGQFGSITSLVAKAPEKFIKDRLGEEEKPKEKEKKSEFELFKKKIDELNQVIRIESTKSKDQEDSIKNLDFSRRVGAAGVRTFDEVGFNNYLNAARKADAYFKVLEEKIKKEGETKENLNKLRELNKVISKLIPDIKTKAIDPATRFALLKGEPNIFEEFEKLA